MNAVRALVGGALGTAGTGLLVGTGAGLLRGTRTGRRVGRLGRRVAVRLVRKKESLDRTIRGRSGRKRRSVPVNVKLPVTKLASSIIDDVPDHLKMVHCGHHEVPNRGHDRDRFCHPEATWKTVLRMRPECVCAPGYVRNSWGDCISYDQCYHCIDKHHLNMDYNLCESKCPLVCNQPINMNCPDTCYQECACRPGYIRLHPNGGPCISIKKCLPGCSSHNQYFALCVSPCPATCANPFPTKCPKLCAGEGCVCKPGYVVLQHEPLVCVRPEECPGFRNRCPGENQVYTPCKPRCPETCWDKQPRMCTTGCAGAGCVCKQGFVVKSANPLVCVHRAQCAMFNHTSHFMHTKSL
ncbi:zonadhesin [Dermacentor silvarum]|uniref:zonadhesin n=1 Tax=Dermacentor silvarum TaxID=543639 RepID=UPI002100906A|nr:zonadhesin [Dermacentor silvarum]